MSWELAKAVEEALSKLNSQDPIFWKLEFGDEVGLVEPERKEWKTELEFAEMKQE